MKSVSKSRKLIVGVAVLAAASIFFVWSMSRTSPAERLQLARVALSHANFKDAERLARLVPNDSPESARALLIAGEAAARLGRHEASLEYYGQIPDDCGKERLTGLQAAVAVAMETGRLSLAETYLRRILECASEDAFATQRLARLLRLEGRRWDAGPLFFQLLTQGQCDVEELVLLGGVELKVDVPAALADASRSTPHDPMLVLWRATQARLRNEPAQAETLLRQVISESPGLVEPHAQLGRLLLDSSRHDELPRWHAALPDGADDHPEIWNVRGAWFEVRQEPHFAVRCFAEVLLRDADHIAANYRLSQLLLSLEQHKQTAEPFLQRANALQQLEDVLFALDENPNDITHMQQAAELTESLGRLWEALGWCTAALRRDPRLQWARSSGIRLHESLNENTPRVLVSSSPALSTDWSEFPLPDREYLTDAYHDPQTATAAETHVAFRDIALSAGLDFRYVNGGTADSGTMKMYEFTGGGAAVLDFDADGRPDVFLTQGGSWPPGSGDLPHRDSLFRNAGGATFQNVTVHAVPRDDRFGQGAAVGDYDNDGFPDLYVGNIGENCFLQNNGDGTFSETTQQTETAGDAWTTSTVMADLNGDTWPDLYVVNYLTGDDIFERVCRTRDKGLLTGICPPAVFDAEQDRCYLNLADGRFQDVTDSCGIDVPHGKGLGIVAFAAGAGDSSGLNLFVANDAVANFYFQNQTARGDHALKFEEQALSTGLAFNQDGRAEACMGIAANDVNQDGLTDFLVTNFHLESNTLYLQQPGGYFIDGTRSSGLRDASLPFLGFGTQFLDAELDGHPDLIVANGHVDDYAHAGIPYRMRPQYFRNLNVGRFEEITDAALGSWFSAPCLGRSVARLDWNRDGREDFIVSSLDAPVALLSNETSVTGTFLAVQLRGVISGRDAIGAQVRVEAGGATHVRQLTAGDGYLASNQRQLIFGLGNSDRVDSLSVKWPSGMEQTFRDIAVNRDVLIVEGRSIVIRLPVPGD